MYRGNFAFYNINFRRNDDKTLIVTGEIKNSSGASYSMTVFNVTLFIQNKAVATGKTKIAGLIHGSTKPFECLVECAEIMEDRTITKINRWDIVFQGGY
ncbi:MAG: hypothetical protein PHR11_00540 [Candidatus Omnitrophica bacterium]|nr:hypothetical protein [Candidatus Omnitrophota bacterium]